MAVFIQGKYIKVLHPNNPQGNFEARLISCGTPEAIREWASFLLGKNWVSRPMAERFVTLLADRIGADRTECLPGELRPSEPLTEEQKAKFSQRIESLRSQLRQHTAK